MAARDRQKINITCEGCGEKTVLGVSEDDHPYMKRLNRSVDFIEGDFTAKMLNEFDVVIHCNKCGHDTTW